ncbi:MAG: hypothetical protein L6R38_006412 [Xanthoria sp. 2 TBL-2021]|nr:MAG: hypothetical protein L6R38_006412 [Xanthoria sp. 2 TBL-2021]
MAPSSPTAGDIFNYRFHHGTNLGTIFVLEKWLSGSMYDGAAGDSELDAVRASLSSRGLDATRSKWQNHWDSALSDDDMNWLVNNARCNMIRLPIGWFTLGPDFCNNTAFAGEPAQVYTNAWSSVKRLVQRCHDHGIGVLIDLHAVPGGANDQIHSGTSSGKAELWGNSFNLDLGRRCLVYIAQEVQNGMAGVIGIQPCNEAAYNAQGMYEWYDSLIRAISAVNGSIPIYISDGWDFGRALPYVQGKNAGDRQGNSIIIDKHNYYCFSASDKSQSAQQIIGRIPQELGELDGKDGNVFEHGAACVLIGEYSCVLDGQTWNQGGDRPSLTKQFGQVQSQRWQGRSSGTSFWTYKMDWMDGGDWGFKEQTNKGAITPPHCLTLSAQDVKNAASNAEGRRQSLRDTAYNEHVQYWDRTSPGQHFEHQRYSDGWNLGWSDAKAFFRARADSVIPGGNVGGDKLGCLDVWVRKRMVEAGQAKSQTAYGWEWEQGFRKGVADFYSAVGI